MEILDVVDKNDCVIGQEERNTAIKTGKGNYRVINIFIYTTEGKIIVPLRSSNRKIFPNCYDFSVGGFVSSGETYEEAAYRELEEELGIKNVILEEIGYFNPKDIGTASFSKLYRLVYDGELNCDKEGIAQIYYFTEKEIMHKLKKFPGKFKGDYAPLFHWMVENISNTIKKAKVITMCGSLKFEEEIRRESERLELEGNCVLSIIYPTRDQYNKYDYTEGQGELLDRLHKQKIDMSDEIFVVNVGGYIGDSTKSEIVYAKMLGKAVRYFEP